MDRRTCGNGWGFGCLVLRCGVGDSEVKCGWVVCGFCDGSEVRCGVGGSEVRSVWFVCEDVMDARVC